MCLYYKPQGPIFYNFFLHNLRMGKNKLECLLLLVLSSLVQFLQVGTEPTREKHLPLGPGTDVIKLFEN